VSSSLPADTVIRHARELSSRIVKLAGEDAIRTVFAGGSVATGDVASVHVDGTLEILSDIDLYIVVADDADEAEVRRASREAAATLDTGADVRYARAHDVGVYTRDDLLAQPLRPGTASVAENHVLLHGDPDVVREMIEAATGTIPPEEGLYLIENRLIEYFSLPREGGAAERLIRFYSLKVCLDAALAELLAAGRYASSVDARIEMLRALEGEHAVPQEALAAYEEAWRSWHDLSASVLDAGPAHIDPDRAIQVAIGAWRRVAHRRYHRARESWSSLLDRRCHFGDYVHNFQQFLILCKRQGRRRREVALSGINLARYAPLDALRVSALAHYAAASESNGSGLGRPHVALEDYLDRLTSLCGHTTGSLAARAAEMCRAVR
jgi:predicted nucleotidyltransferase